MSNDILKIMKSLADNTRMEILTYIPDGKEIACQELMKKFPLTQPTMSRHFNRLVDAGVLNARRAGALWFYSLNRTYLKQIGINIDQIINGINKEK